MRKIVPVVAAGATTLALAVGTFAYATVNSEVTLSVDGRAREVQTTGQTVAEVLSAEGIRVGARDVVAPALDAEVREGTRIAVQFGRQVSVTVDGEQKTYWTTATDVNGALAALGIAAEGAKLSTSRSAPLGRQGLSLEISTRKRVTIDNAGRRQVLTTTAGTVGEALAAAKVKPDADDKLSAGRGTPLANGATITVTRVDVKTVSTTKAVENATVRKDADNLSEGTTRVQAEGKDGERTLTYREVRHNGKLVSRKRTGNTVTTKPVDRVLLVGTKEPEPEPEVREPQDSDADDQSDDAGSNADADADDSSDDSNSSSDSSSSGPPRGVWDRLAQCESGGNWAINTGNGYYGGLQFLPSTWRAYGGSGMPHQASRSEQIRIAEKVQNDVGWGAWPACTRKLGLR